MNLAIFLIFLIAVPVRTDAEQAPTQQFICKVGYSQQDCIRQVAVLRPVLAKFHAESLGQWSWILVRSSEWNDLAQQLGANPHSPAFSVLETRVTVFDEALVAPVPQRRAELINFWHMSISELLDEAVTHEMGHALCHDRNEARANLWAEALQKGVKPTCQVHGNKESGK